MSLFVICLLAVGAGILIALLGRLLASYPLAFFGLIIVVGAGVLAIVDERLFLGIFWLGFSLIAAISAGLNLYKNIRGAFWWCLGALLGLIAVAVTNPDQAEGDILLPLAIPLGIFLFVGLVGSLVMPRVMYRDKDERKHRTNIEPIIGQKLTVCKDKEGGHSQRGFLGDVDWAIEPFFPFESFKVGDVVKVNKIQGVTLLCVRDGKDYHEEQKKLRAEEKAKRKAQEEAERARRAAEKARKEAEKAEEAARKAAEAAEKKAEEKKPEPVKEEPKKEEVKVIEAPKEEPKKEEPKVVEQPKKEPKVEEPAPLPAPEPAPEPKEKAEFVPFAVRLHAADDFLKEAYNELKSEVLSYGIKSRVSSTADTFRLHTKAYVKMVIAGKYLKLYLALDPNDYKDTTYPFDDASRMGAHKDTPFVFKIKSGLSVRRAKVLIADAAKKDNLIQGEVVKHDHVADVKVED